MFGDPWRENSQITGIAEKNWEARVSTPHLRCWRSQPEPLRALPKILVVRSSNPSFRGYGLSGEAQGDGVVESVSSERHPTINSHIKRGQTCTFKRAPCSLPSFGPLGWLVLPKHLTLPFHAVCPHPIYCFGTAWIEVGNHKHQEGSCGAEESKKKVHVRTKAARLSPFDYSTANRTLVRHNTVIRTVSVTRDCLRGTSCWGLGQHDADMHTEPVGNWNTKDPSVHKKLRRLWPPVTSILLVVPITFHSDLLPSLIPWRNKHFLSKNPFVSQQQ